MRYFFGKNLSEVEFRYFRLAHIIPLILLGVVIWLLYHYREKLRASKHEETIRFGLAITMIICEMSYFWRLLNRDMTPNAWDHLPITICGWACIFGSIMLFTKRKFFFNICYFWVLALSFNALITPVPLAYSGPTRFRYYQYWIEHISIYAAVFYMIFVHKYRPTFKSFIPAGGMLLALFFVAVYANSYLGTSPDGTIANYLYMVRTEDSFSIANFLPENLFARYTLIFLFASTLFFLAYLPWFIMDIKKKKRAISAPAEKATEEILEEVQNSIIR